MGSILSQRRQNKEKWRYNEDFEPEPESDIKDLEEEDLSEDDLLDDYGSSCRYEGYHGFDASGKRVCCLILLLLISEGDLCESIYVYKANHLFKARMSEEEADKVADYRLGMRNCHLIQSNWDALDLTCLLGRVT